MNGISKRRVERHRSRKVRRWVLAAVCLSGVMTSGGCRSSMPSWSNFGWKGEPASETIAEVGPTKYPVSPSASANPSSIQSAAASPSGAVPQTTPAPSKSQPESEIAQSESSSPGQTPQRTAQTGNRSAAIANGFGGTQPTYAKPSDGNLPDAASSPSSLTASAGSQPQQAKSGYAAVGYPLPGDKPADDKSAASEEPATQSLSSDPPSVSDGFAMPASEPSSNKSEVAKSSGGLTMPGDEPPSDEPADSNQPDVRTASTDDGAADIQRAAGYAPGSTAGTGGYPAADQSDDSSNSGPFYR